MWLPNKSIAPGSNFKISSFFFLKFDSQKKKKNHIEDKIMEPRGLGRRWKVHQYRWTA